QAISPEQLQRHADAALYLAKQAGRNQVQLHTLESTRNQTIRVGR
ncbi:MAG: GGDEF domain-containing protein, partial [Mesorhizobium sp.]